MGMKHEHAAQYGKHTPPLKHDLTLSRGRTYSEIIQAHKDRIAGVKKHRSKLVPTKKFEKSPNRKNWVFVWGLLTAIPSDYEGISFFYSPKNHTHPPVKQCFFTFQHPKHG